MHAADRWQAVIFVLGSWSSGCDCAPPDEHAGPPAEMDAAAPDAARDADADAAPPELDAEIPLDAEVGAVDAGPDASPDAGLPEPVVCEPIDDFIVAPEEGLIEEASAAAVGGGFVVVYGIRADNRDLLRMALLDPCAGVIDEALAVDETGRFINGARVAALPDGGFLVGWTRADGDQIDDGVVFRTFEADGHRRSAITTANTTETDQQVLYSAVSVTDGVALAWADYSPGAFQDRPNVVLRSFDADGEALTDEILLSPVAEGRQDLPLLASAPDGAMLAAYHEPVQSARLRRLSADGDWLDDEPIVLSLQRKLVTSLAAQEGRYAVALRSLAVEERGDVELALLDADSGEIEGFSIAAAADVIEDDARVTALPDGGWLFAWTDWSLVEDDNGRGVLAVHLSADGTPQGPRFLVPTETHGDQELQALATGPGGTLVVWVDGSQADGHHGDALRAGLLVHDLVEVAQ